MVKRFHAVGWGVDWLMMSWLKCMMSMVDVADDNNLRRRINEEGGTVGRCDDVCKLFVVSDVDVVQGVFYWNGFCESDTGGK